jgi:hypothetical protein
MGIKLEYPQGQRIIEMALVRMLREKRCWADYRDIADALCNIRLHASSMEKERAYLSSDGSNSEDAGNASMERG